MANLEISAESCFPMDFGEPGFTSFEGNEDWFKFFAKYPQVDPILRTAADAAWFIGKIHSHHKMSAFHSGTDTADLDENTPKLPFFLSLVVNYSCIPFAEIGVQAESHEKQVTNSLWKLKNWKGGKKENNIKKETIPATFIIPCDVAFVQDKWFVDQINAIKDKPAPVVTPSYNQGVMGFKQHQHHTNEINKYQKPADSGIETLDKEVYKDVRKSVYQKVLSEIYDLLCLGHSSSNRVAAYTTLTAVDAEVNAKERGTYKKAFKAYFCNTWFDYNFGMGASQAEEIEVIKAIRFWINYHKEKWIYLLLTEALNELEKEHSIIRKI